MSHDKNIVTISGDAYEILSDQEADLRRLEFVGDPEMGLSLDRFSSYMGKQFAEQYFDKVFHNLKYEAIGADRKLTFCPCIQRKKFNPQYVCYGMRCPEKK